MKTPKEMEKGVDKISSYLFLVLFIIFIICIAVILLRLFVAFLILLSMGA